MTLDRATLADGTRTALRALRDLLLPRECGICRERIDEEIAGRLCGGCLEAIEDASYEGRTLCRHCACPSEGTRCSACRKTRLFSKASAFGPFEGELRRAVHALKFDGDSSLGLALGRLTARAAERFPRGRIDAVVPVPLSFERLVERSYNQSAILARVVAKTLRVPLELEWLARTRGAAEQSGSTRAKRRDNVRGAFEASPQVAGRRILVVDDVLTSGATLRECVAALDAKDAKPAWVVVLARAEGFSR